MTVKSSLLSLQSLLNTPEPKDPQDAEVAKMLLHNPKEFERVAQQWAVMYAGAPQNNAAEGSAGESLRGQEQGQQKDDLAK